MRYRNIAIFSAAALAGLHRFQAAAVSVHAPPRPSLANSSSSSATSPLSSRDKKICSHK